MSNLTDLEFNKFVCQTDIVTKVKDGDLSLSDDIVKKAITQVGLEFGPEPSQNDPLKFTSSAGQTLSMVVYDYCYEVFGEYHPNLEYSYDGSEWNTWEGTPSTRTESNNVIYTFDQLSFTEDNLVIYVRGNNPEKFSYKADSWSYKLQCTFVFGNEESVACEGNVMSLISATATELQCDGCFVGLFSDCTNLTTTPELPATVLTESCYGEMFSGCSSLIQAPELPATTLAYSCYNNMFNGCSSLTTAPELPATTLAESCYGSMFLGCADLSYVKCYAKDISASECTSYWLINVSSNGTLLIEDSDDFETVKAMWQNSGSVPAGWDIDVRLPN